MEFLVKTRKYFIKFLFISSFFSNPIDLFFQSILSKQSVVPAKGYSCFKSNAVCCKIFISASSCMTSPLMFQPFENALAFFCWFSFFCFPRKISYYNNHRNGSSDISYLRPFSRDWNGIRKNSKRFSQSC